jgi:Xaa-Pro aminopeptidase
MQPDSVLTNLPRQHGAMEFSDAPVDLDTVRRYRLARLREQLKKRDYAALLLFDQVNTRYATDATNMQVWCSHYETRCAFVPADGPVVLFDYAYLPHLAEDLPTVDEYRALPSFYYFTAGSNAEDRARQFGDQIADLMKKYGGGNKRLAVDRLSHLGTDALRAEGLDLHDGLPVAEDARAIKSAEELALVMAAIHACEDGMRSMREAMRPGITENALWAKLHEANEAGELVSFDTDLIGPYGYCSDISRSWLCGDGKPSDEQRRLYAAAYEQIQHNIGVLKPGKTFREVSEQAWPIPEEFLSNRYGSLIHGVGLADEYPSLKHWVDWEAKGYDGRLEEGMTLCVESFTGVEGGKEGVKLEEQVLITPDGARLLSSYPMETDWL